MPRTNHNGSKADPLYSRYTHILNRLRRNERYSKVSMCSEWVCDFTSFRDWALENGYEPGLTIDRIDNNLGYSPENCRWVDAKTQANNRSSNVVLTYKGETMTASQLCEKYGISRNMLYKRLKRGWDVDRAVETPSRRKQWKSQ